MNIVFCAPELTMNNIDTAKYFYKECKNILSLYVNDIKHIFNVFHLNLLLSQNVEENDILIFFNSENGVYNDKFIKLIRKYREAQCRIWPIAMEKNPECRKPPELISERQSFDVSCRNENRNPLKNNLKAIAQVFSRKIIAQTLSPLYRDEVLYFISHRRIDGEHIASRLADKLKLLTRERNIYRDVVNVKVGDDAQGDIDEKLAVSDVLIFLQTEQAQNSDYIMKELIYAIINDIPVLWIQIDDAPYDCLQIHPGEKPLLSYKSDEFDCDDRLIEIVDEIEDMCFKLIMNTSNQVYSYIDCLNNLNDTGKIKLTYDRNSVLAYELQYKEKTRDIYDDGVRKHYIQCFGRNPKQSDVDEFIEHISKRKELTSNEKMFLLSNHGRRNKQLDSSRIIEENYDDYLMNLENVSGCIHKKNNKRIILSGAFPEYDEIYKNSLLEALVIYSREIIKRGYILVFGAHPSFQQLIFSIGELYSPDVKYSIEMHMDKAYVDKYDLNELQDKCTLILSDGLQEMRENMICKEKSEMLICLGGKIKQDKSQQGVDIEVNLAKKVALPVALVGTVGGRSSEYAYEKIKTDNWSDLNLWDKAINENLFYNVNHRLMIKKLLDALE